MQGKGWLPLFLLCTLPEPRTVSLGTAAGADVLLWPRVSLQEPSDDSQAAGLCGTAEVVRYEYHVLYSSSYQVPVLYFRACFLGKASTHPTMLGISCWVEEEMYVIGNQEVRLLSRGFFSALDSELQGCGGDDIISARGRLIFGSWHLACGWLKLPVIFLVLFLKWLQKLSAAGLNWAGQSVDITTVLEPQGWGLNMSFKMYTVFCLNLLLKGK